MSNDEYQQQRTWSKKELEDFEVEKNKMLEDLMIWGECAYHYPSMKRIHPLDKIITDGKDNL